MMEIDLLANHELTKEARLDLVSIAVYTLENWGEQALDNYWEGLNQTFDKICTGK